MENKQNYKELVDILKEKFNHKNTFIQLIKKNHNLKIPKTHSYEKILSTIIQKDKEYDFAMKTFHCNSLKEIVEKRNIHAAMDIFSKDDLILLATKLSQNQKLWKFDKSSLDNIRNSIVRYSTLLQFQKLFPQLISEQKIYPVMQYYKAVIGPLGITRSKVNRKSMESDELVSFLSKYITKETFKQFLEQTDFSNVLEKYKIDENLKPIALQQLFLTNKTSENIAQIFNILIEDEIIKISEIERYYNYTVTPCGIIIDKETKPIKNLITILIEKIPKNQLEEELKQEGLYSGPLEHRLYGKCVKSKPEEILSNEFGKTDLRKIGEKLGLVRVNKISDIKELIKYVLLQLGFSLPEKIIGISRYIQNLELYLSEIETKSKTEILAIMPNVYLDTEKILKDLIYFYSAIIWNDVLESEDKEDMIESANKRLKSESVIERDISRSSFGQLFAVLKKLNNYTESNPNIKKLLKNKLGRSQLIGTHEISELGIVTDNRAKFIHDVSSNPIPKMLLTPKEIINSLLKVTKKFIDKKIYPTSFRTLKEITNEYGIQYYEILDENNNEIQVFTDEYLETGKTGFMISKTKQVVVNPIIVIKFW